MAKETKRQLHSIMRGYSKQRYETALKTVSHFPYWQWTCIDDSSCCEVCLKRHGKVFHYTDPIWKRLPPIHFGCRCRFRQRSELAMEQLGLVVSSGLDFMDEAGKPR